MPKRPVKQTLNRFGSSVLRQHAIATLLHQLRSGKAVSDKQMESVLLPEQFDLFAFEANGVRQGKAMSRDLAAQRPPWILEYIHWVRKGNLAYERDNNKGESLFEHAAEIMSENYQEGQTELWFDRPVRGLFDWSAPVHDQLDAYGVPISLSPSAMPRVLRRPKIDGTTLKQLKERVLQEAFDAIENKTLSSVRTALAAQNNDDDLEPK